MATANGSASNGRPEPMDVPGDGVIDGQQLKAWQRGLYSLERRACLFCDGYCGPNFNEPVCATCHCFVYPRLPDEEIDALADVCKPEDDDSGNEEPEPEALTSPVKPQNDWNSGGAGPSQVAAVPRNCVAVPAMRKRSDSLAEQIAMLSCPRPEPPKNRVATANPNPVLPPEVWAKVFSYLDDFSLWSVGQVCQSFRNVLDLEAKEANARWHGNFSTRWPVSSTLRRVSERATRGTEFWWRLYGALVLSAPCKTCLYQMVLSQTDDGSDSDPDSPPAPGASGGGGAAAAAPAAAASASASVNDTGREWPVAWRSTRLRMELKILAYEGTEGINAMPMNSAKSVWQASLTGPRGSPYENGTFYLMIKLPRGYPLKPPVVRFLTRIFHPNVSRHGDIGIDCIRHNWTVALSISTILLSIQSIFTDPFTHVCMEPAIGRLYDENYPLFHKIAAKWTRVYAMHHVIPAMNHNEEAGPSSSEN